MFSAFAIADFNNFSIITDDAFGVNLTIAKASSTFFPLIKSTTKTIPTSSYLLVENNEIIGHIFIHHLIDLEVLREYEGHIGYGIRPSKRNQGYGTRMLSLALEKCKDLCLKEVFLSCKKDISVRVSKNSSNPLNETEEYV